MFRILLAGLLFAPSLLRAGDPTPESLDQAVTRLYTLISGPAGHKRDLAELRALLHPQARHAYVRREADSSYGIRDFPNLEKFLAFTQPVWEGGFFEREISRKTEIYGHTAHVFSTYEVRLQADGPVARRGINSFQFVHDGTRWRILSALWEGETDALPIPARYLAERR